MAGEVEGRWGHSGGVSGRRGGEGRGGGEGEGVDGSSWRLRGL